MKTKRYDVKTTDRMMFEFDGELYDWLYEIYYLIAEKHGVDLSNIISESEMLVMLIQNDILVYCDGELL